MSAERKPVMQQTLAPVLPGQQTSPPRFRPPQLRTTFPPTLLRSADSRKFPHEISDPPVSRSAPSAPDSRLARWELARLAGSLVEISGTADSGVLSSALALVAEAQHHQARNHKTRHHKNRHGRHPGSISNPDPALVAWIATTRSLFFPPDAVESGIALDRLVLLRLETPAAQIRAATRIVHSGAFGLVVVDLADSLQPESPSRESSSRESSSRQLVQKSAPNSAMTSGRLQGPRARSPRTRSPRTRSPRARSLMSHPSTSPGVPPLSRLAGLAHKYRTAVVLLTDKPPAAPSLDPRVGKRFDASRKENDIVITVLKDKGNRVPSSPELPQVRGRDRLLPGFRFERKCREPAGMC